jgi:hypothetical protein
MYCATPLHLKVCISQTAATSQVAASCGGYAFIDIVQLNDKTQCDDNEVTLLTYAEVAERMTSPFNLTIANASLIGGSILLAWAAAWAYKQLARSIGNGSPE